MASKIGSHNAGINDRVRTGKIRRDRDEKVAAVGLLHKQGLVVKSITTRE